jgi:hypothetical protein
MSINPADVDDMLHREWNNARSTRRREDMDRLAMRAVDKVLAEFKLLGFAGFRVREIDGQLHIEGISASEAFTTPEFLRAAGGV